MCWLAALGGWAIRSYTPGRTCSLPAARAPRSIADELSKLDLLRKEGILTDEEVEDEKRRLLSRV